MSRDLDKLFWYYEHNEDFKDYVDKSSKARSEDVESVLKLKIVESYLNYLIERDRDKCKPKEGEN